VLLARLDEAPLRYYFIYACRTCTTYSLAIHQGRRAEVKALLGLGRCGEALTVARDAVGLANDAQEPEADTLLRSAMTVRTAAVCGMLAADP
jgi:hypothetical protein